MTHSAPTDEELMALADGALSPADAARVSAAVAADPELARKVEMYRMTGEIVREARGPFAGEEVPEALRQSIEAMIAASEQKSEVRDNVVTFRPRPSAAPAERKRFWAMPVAASLIALIGGAAGYVAGMNAAGDGDYATASVGRHLPAELATALSSSASGSETALKDGRVRLIASVRSKTGTLCREFEVDSASGQTMVGIGCQDGGNWRLDIAVAAPQADGGFAPASSLEAIDSYLGMIDASEPLTPEEEAASLPSLR